MAVFEVTQAGQTHTAYMGRLDRVAARGLPLISGARLNLLGKSGSTAPAFRKRQSGVRL